MPIASSASWSRPATKRLEPVIVLPHREVDGRHRQQRPRQERDQRRDRQPQRGGVVAALAEERDRRDHGGRDDGEQIAGRPAPLRPGLHGADEDPERRIYPQLHGRRLDDQAEADRQHAVRRDVRRRAEPRARGQDLAQLGQRVRGCELGALGAAGDGDDLGRLVQPELADAVDGSDPGRLALAERDDDQRREQADARVWIAVGGGDRAQAILDQAHGVVTHRECGAEAEQQCPHVVCVRLQDTIRISWLVLFRRRPASSVTVTMSSMRTPKRSGR
jgi:hypothetical protein